MYLKIKKIISLLLSNFVIFYVIPYKKKCYVTCAGKTDGLGAQVQAIYSAQLYCFVNKVSYCHTPLNYIEHNYDNNPSFSKETEDFFSFSKDEINISALIEEYKIIDLDSFSIKTLRAVFIYCLRSKNKFIFQKSHFHNFTNHISSKYILIKKQLQDKFYTLPKKNPFTDDDKCLHIAFHIRRGDVDRTDTGRYTDNQIIFDKLNELIFVLKELNIVWKINIYSLGKEEDFGNLPSIATLYLNGNVFDDFYTLVKSDVLFTAKSSFSYSAALLSDGIIIYDPFWHPPLNEWYTMKNNIISADKFREAIKSAVSKKISD